VIKLSAVAFLAFSLALPLLCGCKHKQETDLTRRVDKLEAQQKLTARSLDELLALTKSYQSQNQKMFNDLQRVALSQSTNMDKVGRLFLEHLGNAALHSRTNMDKVERLFLEHVNNSALHSGRQPVAAHGGTQPIQASQVRDGVPLEVFYAITMQAIKKWPRNYQEQEKYIRAEIERYKTLHQ
jgi:hypothetical protein